VREAVLQSELEFLLADRGYEAFFLEFGDGPAVRWLDRTYSREDLKETVLKSRYLSSKSRNYWVLKYRLA